MENDIECKKKIAICKETVIRDINSGAFLEKMSKIEYLTDFSKYIILIEAIKEGIKHDIKNNFLIEELYEINCVKEFVQFYNPTYWNPFLVMIDENNSHIKIEKFMLNKAKSNIEEKIKSGEFLELIKKVKSIENLSEYMNMNVLLKNVNIAKEYMIKDIISGDFLKMVDKLSFEEFVITFNVDYWYKLSQKK